MLVTSQGDRFTAAVNPTAILDRANERTSRRRLLCGGQAKTQLVVITAGKRPGACRVNTGVGQQRRGQRQTLWVDTKLYTAGGSDMTCVCQQAI